MNALATAEAVAWGAKTCNIVICPSCKERHDVNDVYFLNIEVDVQGADVMTFTCPRDVTHENLKSRVFMAR